MKILEHFLIHVLPRLYEHSDVLTKRDVALVSL